MSLYRYSMALLALLACAAGCGESAPPPQAKGRLIPLEDFFRNPEKTDFKISPDGRSLAYRGPWQRRLNIFVQKLGEAKVTRVTNATRRDIAGYLWAKDNRLVYLQDTAGDENFRAYAVDPDGGNPKDLTPFPQVKVRFLDDLEKSPDEILIAMNRRDPKFFDAYRVNVYTGALKMVGENPGNISSWLADNNGQVAGGGGHRRPHRHPVISPAPKPRPSAPWPGPTSKTPWTPSTSPSTTAISMSPPTSGGTKRPSTAMTRKKEPGWTWSRTSRGGRLAAAALQEAPDHHRGDLLHR